MAANLSVLPTSRRRRSRDSACDVTVKRPIDLFSVNTRRPHHCRSLPNRHQTATSLYRPLPCYPPTSTSLKISSVLSCGDICVNLCISSGVSPNPDITLGIFQVVTQPRHHSRYLPSRHPTSTSLSISSKSSPNLDITLDIFQVVTQPSHHFRYLPSRHPTSTSLSISSKSSPNLDITIHIFQVVTQPRHHSRYLPSRHPTSTSLSISSKSSPNLDVTLHIFQVVTQPSHHSIYIFTGVIRPPYNKGYLNSVSSVNLYAQTHAPDMGRQSKTRKCVKHKAADRKKYD